MEANLGGKAHNTYGPLVPNLKALGKRSMEWDLNEWKWDGDLFSATPLNSLPSDRSARQLSNIPLFCPNENGTTLRNEFEKRDLDKRRRDSVVEEGDGPLNLKLGGQVFPIADSGIEKCDGNNGKRSKVIESSSNHRSVCQVEDCRVDLTHAKDYHRRHKVCELHSKATRALVGNVMQRFCQQCSRFHVLEEFDEGKRSCRRRLAGHNRRRRKTHPENVVNSNPLTDERSSSYLLVSLLRILTNMHANNSDQAKDQDFISHLLKNLAGSSNGGGISTPPDNAKGLHDAGTSTEAPQKEPLKPNLQPTTPPLPLYVEREKQASVPNPLAIRGCPENAERRMKLNDFDLNNVYDDSQDCEQNLETRPCPMIHGRNSPDCSLWGHQVHQKSSPPQTSGNSGSLSTLSPSSSSGEAQSRTEKIVFKLFGKDPSDFPLILRKQILDWLSSSPTDIESYIRPGCIILTIYLRLGKSTWKEICSDLSSSLMKLLETSEDSFWKVGWMYTRVLHHVAFMHNGRVVLDTVLPPRSQKSCSILSIKPIAVSFSKRAQFWVRGVNLSQSTTRLLCALEGKYLAQESCSDSDGESNMFVSNTGIQCLSFSCAIPDLIGRGFIEVEDQSLNSSFFPFIVAEQDVCTEICTLESTLEVTEIPDHQSIESEKTKAKNDALEFIHEMGWLLHRTQLMFKHGPIEPNSGLFPLKRFRWLMEYSIEHDWCAVVKKLLYIVFNGIVDAGDYASMELALLEMSLLHGAVRRNCRSMVENLLRYVPEQISDKQNGTNTKSGIFFLFRPDATGPGGLTPLHVAACKEGSENVLDALTDDPGLVGIQAWKCARDNTGLTPNDYASLRGHYSYINLVQKKINRVSSRKGHVVVDIEKPTGSHKSSQFTSFNSEKNEMKQIYQLDCKQCEQKMAYAYTRTSFGVYRPAMLSMLAIAAVCVCAALLFKSSPKVDYVFQPFRWENLKYGFM